MGVLRGGSLKKKETESINEIFATSKKKDFEYNFKKNKIKNNRIFQDIFVTWLKKSYDNSSYFSSFMERYRLASSGEFDKIAAKRLAHLKETPFVGSQKCSTCHQEAYLKWQNSKHAQAFPTLVKKKREKNISCIKCHVLAWEEKGGFVSQEHSPNFMNVQCENCHGPRKEHIKNPSIKSKKANIETCLKCHNKKHSPSFEYKTFWSKINHK